MSQLIDFGGVRFDAQDFQHCTPVVNIANELRLDAGSTAMVLRDLTFLRAELKEVKYEPLKARSLFSMSNVKGSGFEFINNKIVDYSGAAEFVSDDSDTFPSVSAKITEESNPVRRFGASFRLSEMDIIKAIRANVPLQTSKVKAAMRANEELLDNTIFNGNKAQKLKGLWSYQSNLTSVTIAADGTGASKLWSTKTGALMLRDVLAMCAAIPNVFKGMALTLVVDPVNYTLLMTTRLDSNSDTTVAEFLLAKTDITSIDRTSKLETVSTLSNNSSGILYPKDPEIAEIVLPVDREEKAPYMVARTTVYDYASEFSGLHVHHPKGIVYADSI